MPIWVLKSPALFLYVLDQRAEITAEVDKKSGIYCWYNLENGNFYVGSGVNLRNRINDYFQPSYYKAKSEVVIVRAIVKHKMDKFALVILEYTSGHDLIPREQYWIDTLKPKYNVLKKAGNSEGYEHTPETKAILSRLATGRKHSPEVRKAMSENRKGELGSFHGHHHTPETKARFRVIALNRKKLPRPGFLVKVTDLTVNETITYSSMREAARALNTHISTILRREKKKITEPFRKQYDITVLRNNSPQG